MNKKLAKALLFVMTIALILVAIFVLFKSDLFIISSQVAESAGVIKPQERKVFSGGYVEYIEENSNMSAELVPALSAIQAKLIIPRLRIEGNILEGSNEDIMNHGFWHYPSASPFSKSGNVVIIGHRYLKLPPNKDTFYHLDWIKVGDRIDITSTRETITYIVREQKIVSVDDNYVLNQTINEQLTLITCHPLWTSKERLVIIADKVKESND